MQLHVMCVRLTVLRCVDSTTIRAQKAACAGNETVRSRSQQSDSQPYPPDQQCPRRSTRGGSSGQSGQKKKKEEEKENTTATPTTQPNKCKMDARELVLNDANTPLALHLSRAPVIVYPDEFVIRAISDGQRDFSSLLELLDDSSLLRRCEAAANDRLAHAGQLQKCLAQQQRLGLQALVLIVIMSVAAAATRAPAPHARGRGLPMGGPRCAFARCASARFIGEEDADGLAFHHQTDGRALQPLALLLFRAVAGDQARLAQALKANGNRYQTRRWLDGVGTSCRPSPGGERAG